MFDLSDGARPGHGVEPIQPVILVNYVGSPVVLQSSGLLQPCFSKSVFMRKYSYIAIKTEIEIQVRRQFN